MSGALQCLPVISAQPAVADAGWRSVRAGGEEWEVRGAYAELLLGPTGLRLGEWAVQGALEVVKTGPHRTVHRVGLPEGEFYLKHFRVADAEAWLRNVFRGSPAERELAAAQRIAALRLPTFEPVALGRRRVAGTTLDSWLISRALPEALPLDHFLLTEFPALPAARQTELRRRLAEELGALAARLHAAAIEHVDLHAGNLLIRPNPAPGEALLALIDLHAVSFRTKLSARRRERNLAALHQFFAGRSTRADRGRFALAYHAHRATVPASGWELRLELLLEQTAQAGWCRADRAWRRGNRHVRRSNAGTTACRGVATLDAARIVAVRDDPEGLFERHLIRWHKRSSARRVAEVAWSDTGDESPSGRAFWKEIVVRGWVEALLSRLRDSPVRRAWEAGHALLRRGIDTPRPLLFVDTVHPRERRGYLLTEAVPNTVTAHDYFRTHWTGLDADRRSARLTRRTERLAGQLRRLHDAGFDHRDLKFPNLLVSTAEADDRVWLLDLDHVRRWRRLPRFRAVQNLARLAVSALLVEGLPDAQRLRFLRRYLGPRFAAEWKWWWRAVAAKARRKIATNHRRARPLS